ncbi:MAG: hypothetical protein Q9165_006432 [Trypethelium subeluteriae]
MADTEDLRAIYQFAIRLGRDAGQLLLQSVKSRYGSINTDQSHSQEFLEKENAVDLVTKVDEAFIIDHEPTIGVVYAPFVDQMFSACKGKGAWMNETQQLPLVRNPIPPMPASAPKGCIFSFEWGKDRRDSPDGNMQRKVESLVNMAAEIGSRGGKGGMNQGKEDVGNGE